MMSKRLLVVASVVMMIAWVDGCGEKQNATPTEQMIKEDITNNYKDYLDLNVYLYADIYGLFGNARQERDVNITSLKIQKSKTDDDSYSAWCEVAFEDEYYKDSSVIIVTYNKYDNNYWEMRDMYEEINTRKSEALQAPPVEAVIDMVSNIQSFSPADHIIESHFDNNVCNVKMKITNCKAFQGDIEEGFPAEEILDGFETFVDADVNLTFEYDGLNIWQLVDFESELPDPEEIIKYSSPALKKSARFVLNGDRNIDSLYIDSSWSDGYYYYFNIKGDGGVVVLCEEYLPRTMDLYFVGLDVSQWDYQPGKMTEGHAIFFDPGKYLVPHL